jgi:hypothetical protein
MRAYYFASLLCATNYVHASLDSYIYYFAGNNGNSSAARKCSTSSVYECPAPSMCAIDNVTKKQYCCAPGSSDAICWAASTKCEGSSSDQPSSTQSGCTNLGVSYCCLKDQERCTGNASKFNSIYGTSHMHIHFDKHISSLPIPVSIPPFTYVCISKPNRTST